MGLRDIFHEEQEKIEERSLEVVASEDSIVNEWLAYFKNTKRKFAFLRSTKKGYLGDYFIKSQTFLKSYEVKPELIRKFNEKINLPLSDKEKDFANFFLKPFKILEPEVTATSSIFNILHNIKKDNYLGVLLSAMIQTSYDQGFNNFEFDRIESSEFGSFLEGKKDNLIAIKAGLVYGDYALNNTKRCSLEARTIFGSSVASESQDCSLNLENLIGSSALNRASSSILNIKNYRGSEFGDDMRDCTIASPDQKTLKKIIRQILPYKRKENTFKLTSDHTLILKDESSDILPIFLGIMDTYNIVIQQAWHTHPYIVILYKFFYGLISLGNSFKEKFSG